MIIQKVGAYEIQIKTADELGGYPSVGKNDAALIRIYKNGEKIDSAWLTVSKNGNVRLERIK